jgi:hypothetical protein
MGRIVGQSKSIVLITHRIRERAAARDDQDRSIARQFCDDGQHRIEAPFVGQQPAADLHDRFNDTSLFGVERGL